MSHTIVHFEIPADDPEALDKFYSDLFDWKILKVPMGDGMEYFMVHTVPTDDQGMTLEPGVTQGELSQYLQSRGLPFMVPVTGAGPSCSIVANALERGFGVTPLTDHCGAIVSMKVVLPDGELYESYTRTFNTAGVARAYKWATGPYFERVQRLAKAVTKALRPDGVVVTIFNGAPSGQTIFYPHFHIIPRYEGVKLAGHGHNNRADMAELQSIAQSIAAAM